MQTSSSFPPLSANQQHLVQLVQQVHFGRIERLAVRAGDPVFDPPPHVVRDFKFGGDNTPRRPADGLGGPLKPQFRELFAILRALGDGLVERIEVKYGTPFLMRVVTHAD